MERLRSLFGEIGRRFKGLTASQRLAVMCLGVIMAMTLVLAGVLGGGPERVALLAGADLSEQERAATALQAKGFDVTMEAGTLMVPSSQRYAAYGHLASTGGLPSDGRVTFNNLVDRQDWIRGTRENERQAMYALQNELSRIIGRMDGFVSGEVILDVPVASGLGRTSQEPTASVTVHPYGATGLTQQQVDAVAHLVAHAVSRLTVDRVVVIDARANRHYRARSDADMGATTILDAARRAETETREKLEKLLYRAMPGVMVEVTALVDPRRQRSVRKAYLPEEGGSVAVLERTGASTLEETAGVRGASPGTNSNQAADIRRAPGGESSSVGSEETDTSFAVGLGTEETESLVAQGMPTHLSASVVVPEDVVRGLLASEGVTGGGEDEAEGEGGGGPTAEQVRARFEELAAAIRTASLRHLIGTGPDGKPVPGEIEVVLLPTYVPAGVGSAGGGVLGAIGIGGGLFGGDGLIANITLGALSLISLGMMILMVRRTTKREPLPTARELVGIPPALEGESDVVGEVDENQSPLTGYEIDDADVSAVRTLEQLTQLVERDPGKVARLVNRWIELDEE